MKMSGANFRSKEIGPGSYDVGEATDTFYQQKKKSVLNMIRASKNQNLVNTVSVFVPKLVKKSTLKNGLNNELNSQISDEQNKIQLFESMESVDTSLLGPEFEKMQKLKISKTQNFHPTKIVFDMIEQSPSPVKYVFIVEDEPEQERLTKMATFPRKNFQNFKSKISENLSSVLPDSQNNGLKGSKPIEASVLNTISYKQLKFKHEILRKKVIKNQYLKRKFKIKDPKDIIHVDKLRQNSRIRNYQPVLRSQSLDLDETMAIQVDLDKSKEFESGSLVYDYRGRNFHSAQKYYRNQQLKNNQTAQGSIFESRNGDFSPKNANLRSSRSYSKLNFFEVLAILNDVQHIPESILKQKILDQKKQHQIQALSVGINNPKILNKISEKTARSPQTQTKKRAQTTKKAAIKAQSIDMNQNNILHSTISSKIPKFEKSSFQKKIDELTSEDNYSTPHYNYNGSVTTKNRANTAKTLFRSRRRTKQPPQNLKKWENTKNNVKDFKLKQVLSKDTRSRINLINRNKLAKTQTSGFKTLKIQRTINSPKLPTMPSDSKMKKLPGFMKKTIQSNELMKKHLNMEVGNPEDFIPVQSMVSPYETFTNFKKAQNLSQSLQKTAPMFYQTSKKQKTCVTPGMFYTSSSQISKPRLSLGQYRVKQPKLPNKRDQKRLRGGFDVDELRKDVRERSLLSYNRGNAVKVFSSLRYS